MAKNFPKLTEDIESQIQHVLQTLGRIISKISTFKYITIKLKDKIKF